MAGPSLYIDLVVSRGLTPSQHWDPRLIPCSFHIKRYDCVLQSVVISEISHLFLVGRKSIIVRYLHPLREPVPLALGLSQLGLPNGEYAARLECPHFDRFCEIFPK